MGTISMSATHRSIKFGFYNNSSEILKNYQKYTSGDWIEDADFRDWVFSGRQKNIVFDQLLADPKYSGEMLAAKMTLEAIRGDLKDLKAEDLKGEIDRIAGSISGEPVRLPVFRGSSRTTFTSLLVAASIALLIGMIWVLQSPGGAGGEQAVIVASRDSTLRNDRSVNMLLSLPDGSSVLLSAGSSLRFPRVFTSEKREVFLQGEAFFEIAKDPLRPFHVYADHLIATAVGTSFIVRARPADKEISVVVKTGRVLLTKTGAQRSAERDAEGQSQIVLGASQKGTLHKDKLTLVKEQKLIKAEQGTFEIATQPFNFKRTPIPEVFSVLEQNYGVKIVFDSAVLDGCTLTAELGDEPLPEKLNMICSVIGARYEMGDGIFRINAQGCI